MSLPMKTQRIWSIATLILTNSIPIIGFLFFDWHPFNLLYLYTVEIALITLTTFLKINVVFKGAVALSILVLVMGGLGVILYFSIGMLYFLPNYEIVLEQLGLGRLIIEGIRENAAAVAALLLIYGGNFFARFLWQQEYKTITHRATLTTPFVTVIVAMEIVTVFMGNSKDILFALMEYSWVVLIVIYMAKLGAECFVTFYTKHSKNEAYELRFPPAPK